MEEHLIKLWNSFPEEVANAEGVLGLPRQLDKFL